MADKFNIDTLIADAKAARVKAEQDAAAAAKAAALSKKNKDAINKARLQAEPQITYAKSLESEMATLEGQLRGYATSIARGDKLDPTTQAAFDRTVAQYKSLSKTYTATNDKVVKIFSAAPGADVAKLTGNKDLATKTVDTAGDVVDKPAPGVDWSAYAIGANGVTKGNQNVVFVSTTDANGNVQPKEFNNLSQARAEFLKGYSSPEALKSLQNSLVNKHYIKSSQIQDGTWVAGLDSLIQKYSIKLVSDALYNPSAKSVNTNQFLASTASLGNSSTPTQFKTITTRADAERDFNNYMNDLVGRPATPEEQDAYYNQLHAAEDKAVRTTKGGVTTGSTLADTDRVMIAAHVARNTLRGTDVEKLLGAGKGSQTANDIAALQSYAADYGVDMSAADALKYVAAGLGSKDYLAKQEERIRQLGMTLHPYLKDHIAAGGTVRDVAVQYAAAKKTKLGVVVTDPTKDKDVMDALSKGVSISDFNRALQAKPEWRTTEEAHTITNDYAQKILSSFGFGG
jgi:hypothetical protein